VPGGAPGVCHWSTTPLINSQRGQRSNHHRRQAAGTHTPCQGQHALGTLASGTAGSTCMSTPPPPHLVIIRCLCLPHLVFPSTALCMPCILHSMPAPQNAAWRQVVAPGPGLAAWLLHQDAVKPLSIWCVRGPCVWGTAVVCGTQNVTTTNPTVACNAARLVMWIDQNHTWLMVPTSTHKKQTRSVKGGPTPTLHTPR
jgi:hypothetical protein